MNKKIIEVEMEGSTKIIYCQDLSKIHFLKKRKTPALPNFHSNPEF